MAALVTAEHERGTRRSLGDEVCELVGTPREIGAVRVNVLPRSGDLGDGTGSRCSHGRAARDPHGYSAQPAFSQKKSLLYPLSYGGKTGDLQEVSSHRPESGF